MRRKTLNRIVAASLSYSAAFILVTVVGLLYWPESKEAWLALVPAVSSLAMWILVWRQRDRIKLND